MNRRFSWGLLRIVPRPVAEAISSGQMKFVARICEGVGFSLTIQRPFPTLKGRPPMIALALALGLVASAGPNDTDLPRSLSVDETPFLAPAPVQKDEFQIWVGGHMGITDAYDAEDVNFVFGANVRMKFLSWLGAEGTFDI